MNSVPEAYTKSAPTTTRIVAGKPYAQYGADGLINAKKRHPAEEPRVPVTVREQKRGTHEEERKLTNMPRVSGLTEQKNHRYAPYDDRNEDVTNDAGDKHRQQTHCRAQRRVSYIALIIQLRDRARKFENFHIT
jgi:hypothetical protein